MKKDHRLKDEELNKLTSELEKAVDPILIELSERNRLSVLNAFAATFTVSAYLGFCDQGLISKDEAATMIQDNYKIQGKQMANIILKDNEDSED